MEKLFLRLSSQENIKRFEKVVVFFAIVFFLIHILLIFFTHQIQLLPLQETVSPNYLSSIITPIEIIFFYEVFLLVLAIPRSIAFSILKQMEILVLLLVREVFKLLPEIENFETIWRERDLLTQIALFFGSSVVAFLLVAVFKLIVEKALLKSKQTTDSKILYIKNIFTLFVIILLVIFVIIDVTSNLLTIFGVSTYNFEYIFPLLFVLIFVDVLIFLFSLVFSDDLGIIYIDSAFILSAIFLRFAIAIGGTPKIIIVLATMVASITALSIYTFLWKKGREYIGENTI
ncbi:MAG: hypothetical protein ACOCXT_04775 [Candidatus Dojkabacteria bacterium]